MRRSTKLSLWIIFFLLVVYLVGRFNHKSEELVSPLIKSDLTKQIVNAFLKSDLKKIVETVLKDTKGRYGIFIKNLRTGESYFYNENETFEPGSLYKLWLMGTVFEKIKEGTLEEDKILSDKIEEINKKFKIASDEPELEEGEIEVSVLTALDQMITISHNYAALLLTKEVGVSKITQFLKEYNFNQSQVGDSLETTPSDIGKFFEMLYQGEIINKEYSDKMLAILSRQEIKDRLPKNLPKEVKIAHKTADFGFFEHDGGIVFSPQGDYIIVVLSKSEFPDAAGKKIADLSKVVFDYFNK